MHVQSISASTCSKCPPLRGITRTSLRSKRNTVSARCFNHLTKGIAARLTTVYATSIPELHTSSIQSTSNAYVKHCVRLRSSNAYRQEVSRVIVTGVAPLTELAVQVAQGRGPRVFTLFVSGEGEGPQIGSSADGLPPADRAVNVSAAVMQKLAGFDSPPSGLHAAAEVELPAPVEFAAGGNLQRLLVLDGLQDPGNVGTLMRTAVALGWQGVFCLPGCCDLFNDKAVRAARGAAFRLPHASGTWDDLQLVARHHKMTCIAATSPPAGVDPQNSVVSAISAAAGEAVMLVLGAEGSGPSSATLETCRSITLPMQGGIESLNVASAGSILMYALSRP